jgi:hypothetical protein
VNGKQSVHLGPPGSRSWLLASSSDPTNTERPKRFAWIGAAQQNSGGARRRVAWVHLPALPAAYKRPTPPSRLGGASFSTGAARPRSKGADRHVDAVPLLLAMTSGADRHVDVVHLLLAMTSGGESWLPGDHNSGTRRRACSSSRAGVEGSWAIIESSPPNVIRSPAAVKLAVCLRARRGRRPCRSRGVGSPAMWLHTYRVRFCISLFR